MATHARLARIGVARAILRAVSLTYYLSLQEAPMHRADRFPARSFAVELHAEDQQSCCQRCVAIRKWARVGFGHDGLDCTVGGKVEPGGGSAAIAASPREKVESLVAGS